MSAPTATCTFIYNLSEAGQRAVLAEGRPGTAKQELVVTIADVPPDLWKALSVEAEVAQDELVYFVNPDWTIRKKLTAWPEETPAIDFRGSAISRGIVGFPKAALSSSITGRADVVAQSRLIDVLPDAAGSPATGDFLLNFGREERARAKAALTQAQAEIAEAKAAWDSARKTEVEALLAEFDAWAAQLTDQERKLSLVQTVLADRERGYTPLERRYRTHGTNYGLVPVLPNWDKAQTAVDTVRRTQAWIKSLPEHCVNLPEVQAVTVQYGLPAPQAAVNEAKSVVEAAIWTREHGSQRLRRIAEAGLLSSSLAVYRDERLALERPGWRWESSIPGERKDIRNASEEALNLLDVAQEHAPDASLAFYKVIHTMLDEGFEVEEVIWSGPVAEAEFLSRDILLFPPGTDLGYLN